MPRWALIAVLIFLSAIKGALVVMFFMHLRFDSKWFRFFFIAGIILATFGIITFLVLFNYRAGFVE
jgi:cytochrome c oxidase subunit IV